MLHDLKAGSVRRNPLHYQRRSLEAPDISLLYLQSKVDPLPDALCLTGQGHTFGDAVVPRLLPCFERLYMQKKQANGSGKKMTVPYM